MFEVGQTNIMIEDTIKKIEARINSSGTLSDERRYELVQLLAKLKAEVNELSRTHDDEARSITGFVQVSAHEATRDTRNPELLGISLQGLRSSVEGFEKSHPQLVQIVNSISNTLSNLGI